MKTSPSPLASLDAVALWAMLISFERRLAAELEPLGLTVSGFRLIGEVMTSPDGIRQSELARRLGVRAPTISAAVRRLEERGFVYRTPDPDDPRARRVCISPETSLQAGVDVLSRLDERLFGSLTPTERATTRALIKTMADRLEDDDV